LAANANGIQQKETTMNRPQFTTSALSAILAAGALGLTSCSSDNKAECYGPIAPSAIPTAESATQPASPDRAVTIAVEDGKAGGVIEDSFTASATVNAIDPSTREVTLTSDDGRKNTFTCGPDVRNFNQIHVGDKVNATITERLVVFVNRDGIPPSATHAGALARAPEGAKPGMMMAESYEITARVEAIDIAGRTATLLFPDGQTKTVTIRADVDPSHYKVGDTVVIRATDSLSLLVEKP
jgi:translation elongation factor P/translation initiation factor 5A